MTNSISEMCGLGLSRLAWRLLSYCGMLSSIQEGEVANGRWLGPVAAESFQQDDFALSDCVG